MYHPNHEQLVAKISLRTNIYIHGPTGSGKTEGIKRAAKACNLPFYKKLLGNQTSESSIIGYMSANGDYVKGIAYDAFTTGGILCMDEVDNGNPNTTLVCNGLADREFAFPCGMREAHKDFVLVATANTIGTGATLEYCGRNRLDAAMLNRFEFINWGYDEQLEFKIADLNAIDTATNNNQQVDLEAVKSLVEDIQRFRLCLKDLNINHIISPRNTIQAVKAFVIGRPRIEIIKSILFKGIDNDTIKRVFEKAQKIISDKQRNSGGEVKTILEDVANEHINLATAIIGEDKVGEFLAKQQLNKAKANFGKGKSEPIFYSKGQY